MNGIVLALLYQKQLFCAFFDMSLPKHIDGFCLDMWEKVLDKIPYGDGKSRLLSQRVITGL